MRTGFRLSLMARCVTDSARKRLRLQQPKDVDNSLNRPETNDKHTYQQKISRDLFKLDEATTEWWDLSERHASRGSHYRNYSGVDDVFAAVLADARPMPSTR